MRCSLEKVVKLKAVACGGRTDRKNAQKIFSSEERRPGWAGPGCLLFFDVALGPYGF
jgi:hypothetical protein